MTDSLKFTMKVESSIIYASELSEISLRTSFKEQMLNWVLPSLLNAFFKTLIQDPKNELQCVVTNIDFDYTTLSTE